MSLSQEIARCIRNGAKNPQFKREMLPVYEIERGTKKRAKEGIGNEEK